MMDKSGKMWEKSGGTLRISQNSTGHALTFQWSSWKFMKSLV